MTLNVVDTVEPFSHSHVYLMDFVYRRYDVNYNYVYFCSLLEQLISIEILENWLCRYADIQWAFETGHWSSRGQNISYAASHQLPLWLTIQNLCSAMSSNPEDLPDKLNVVHEIHWHYIRKYSSIAKSELNWIYRYHCNMGMTYSLTLIVHCLSNSLHWAKVRHNSWHEKNWKWHRIERI